MSSLEKTLIGTLLNHPSWVAKVDLQPHHFSDSFCKMVFTAMRAIAFEGRSADPWAVTEKVGEQELIALIELQRECPATPDNLSYWAKQIRAGYRGREMRSIIATELAKDEDADAIRARLITNLAAISDEGKSYSQDSVSLMTSVVDYLEEAHNAHKTGGIVGVPSGISGIDKNMGGFHKSDLIIVGARTSVGKTAFLLSIALNAAKSGSKVGIVSAEMSSQQIGLRFTSMIGNIDSYRLRSGDMDENEYAGVTKAAAIMKGLDIRVFDKPACSVGDVALQARAWMQSGGLDILYVDYLTRLTPDEEQQNRTREVGKMVFGLKTLAKSLDIPVVCLAQINRESDKRADKRPLMSDLRDSGEIEQEADSIMLLYRDSMHNENAPKDTAEIIIDKNRHGPCATVKATFIGETMTWKDCF
jgi:replicative DNA helicase